MIDKSLRLAFAILITFFIGVLAGPNDSPAAEGTPVMPLLVGVTPDSPPMIFRQQGAIAGLEADLARMLAGELGMPLRFVELPWDRLMPSLLDGEIDIIMSGMTITEARKVRIAFTDYYLKSGLVVAMRAGDFSKYNSLERIKEKFPTVGVIKNTTGEAYARKNFPPAMRIIPLQGLSDAAIELKQRRIDIFVHDAPAVVWLVSENEASMRGLWKPLNEEYLGWGIRRDDGALLARVNAVLAGWKQNGTLKSVITRWLPYWKDLE
ncbi:MAG TPA: transporter substrate-binding domain-containing protein [Thermodesulfovibrionales bacterium]|nr:transporter substrate-binding domain-containing protein [Thermodesulfovibrionales bacterium]